MTEKFMRNKGLRIILHLFGLCPLWMKLAVGVLSILVAFCEGLSMTFVVTLFDGGILEKLPSFLEPLQRWLNGITPVEKVRMVTVFLVGITLFKGIALYSFSYITTLMQIRVRNQLREKCVKQLLSVSMKYIRDQKISDLFTIITNYTKWTGTIIGDFNFLIPKIFSGFVLLFILIQLSWPLTLASLVFLFLSSLSLQWLSHESKITGEEDNKKMLKLSDELMALIQGIKEVHLFNKEKQLSQQTTKFIREHGKAGFRNAMANSLVQPVFEVTIVIMLAVILYFASVTLPSDNVDWMPTLLSFMIILFRMVMPISSINQTRVQMAGNFPPVEKLFDFLDSKGKDYIPNGQKKLNVFQSTIRFENITFKYHSDKVLNDVCLTISKGEKIGIVGPSGSGKSTLVELLLRFYDPAQGAIYVDDIDIRNLDISSWRDVIGVVSQDTFIFNQTVLQNIAFGDESTPNNLLAIQKAARIAHADGFISGMPDSYKTILGERGVKISGGQRQRLAIARAVLRKPSILIFDEATSALDSESERIVQQALNEIGKNKTTIIVAHRLSTVFDADQIIVLDQGRIVQKGRHMELMQQEGLYKRLVELQDLNIMKIRRI